MKERPILFSAPMVQAILAGEKTQTRRVVKGADLELLSSAWKVPFLERQTGAWYLKRAASDSTGVRIGFCPYGQPGDRLWVRETFTLMKLPLPLYGAVQLKRGPVLDADSQLAAWYDGDEHPGGWPTKLKRVPSIHMPRWASRILLEIVSVRVERLQDISGADARAEGFEDTLAFQNLWKKINGQDSWQENPWVWVVEFKVVKPC